MAQQEINEKHSGESLPSPRSADDEIMEVNGTDEDQAATQSTQFWRSSQAVVAEKKLSTTDNKKLQGIPRPLANTKFLHSNATSHKWAFGAIAELIDNAVDEIPNGATYVVVDRITNPRDNAPALLIQDNGGGMDPEGLRRCVGLGFSSKDAANSVGRYGNGFKTSTMRLATDAIVFTRTLPPYGSLPKFSVALLSQTFLIQTQRTNIVAPVLDFEISSTGQPMAFLNNPSTALDAWNHKLNVVLQWSPFSTLELLLKQFEDIGAHGTKIVLYNLYNDSDVPELDFDTDCRDIQLQRPTIQQNKYQHLQESHISYRLKFSLRAYASILYLNPLPNNFQIILRRHPVKPYRIAETLEIPKVVTYKPAKVAQRVCVNTTLGFIENARQLNVHGFNIYHKNRLILPFWKVFQESSSRGRGIVGVLEVNYIQPTHDKQDFERTDVFARLENKLKEMQLDFWKQNCHLIGYQNRSSKSSNAAVAEDQIAEEAATDSALPSKRRRSLEFDDNRKRRRSSEFEAKTVAEENRNPNPNPSLSPSPSNPINSQKVFTESSELQNLRQENAELRFQLERHKAIERQQYEALGRLQIRESEWRNTVQQIEQLRQKRNSGVSGVVVKME